MGKLLFFTRDGGRSWALISQTTTSFITPVAGVGDLPLGGGVSALIFTDLNDGWMGFSGPGDNLFRSTDGGHHWSVARVAGLEPGRPVTSITFSSDTDGMFTAPDATFTTTDGGANWELAP